MNIIVCVDKNWGIGCENALVFTIKEDMQHFKEITTGKVVVMGAKTFDSLPFPNGLPNRINIVLSSKMKPCEGVIVCHGIEKLKEEIEKFDTEDVFIIGGETIYKMFLPYVKTAYVTKVNEEKHVDTYFPNLDALSNWKNTEEKKHKTKQEFSFNVYKNSKVKSLSSLCEEKG